MHSCSPGKKMPPCNKTVEKRFDKEKKDKYYERLQNVKPFLDLTPPKKHQHLQLSVKKTQMQQERQDAIDRQNQVILSALKQSKARVDNWNKDWKPRKDTLRSRERNERPLKFINQKQRERLKKVQPCYNKHEWEKDFKKHQYYLRMRDRGTKDYNEVEDREEQELAEKPAEKTKSAAAKEKAKPRQAAAPAKDKTSEKKKKEDQAAAEEDVDELAKVIEAENKQRIVCLLAKNCSDNSKLKKLQDKYRKKQNKDLLETLKPILDEDLQETVELLLIENAEHDAKSLHYAMKGSETDKVDIISEILCARSNSQMKEISEAHEKMYENSLETDPKGETAGDLETLLVRLSKMDGDMRKAFMTLVKCSHMGKLYRALREKNTKAVASIVLTKNKEQIDELAAAYKRSNKVELAHEVDKKCEGDIKTLILAKLGRVKGESKKQRKLGNKRTGDDQNAAKLKGDEAGAGHENDASGKVKEDPVALMKKDLDELREAVDDGNKDKVVHIIARHCDEKSKLKELKEKYKQKHDQDLLETVKPILDEEQLQDAMESLFMEASSYDAKLLYNAIKGLGPDEDILIEILCARTNAEIEAIRKTYSNQYGTSLDKDIKGDTGGDFEDLLVELTKGRRDESSEVDKSLAKKDSEALEQARFRGTDKSKLTEVFTQRSLAHVRAMFQEYKRTSNLEMETSMEEERNQDTEKGFSVLVKYSRDPANFYAAKLHNSFKKDNTDTACRIILTSTTVELAKIIAGYKALYKKDLSSDAETKFSENMRKLILPRLKKGDGNSSVSLSGAASKKKSPRLLEAPSRLLLQIKVLRGHNVTLGKLHDFEDTPDPYVKLLIPTSPQGFCKTTTKSDTADPVWDEDFSFILDPKLPNVLKIALLDSDPLQDDPIRTKTFDLSNLELGKTHTETFVFHKESSVEVKMLLKACAEPSEMRYSTELCEKERTFIEKRKKSVFNAMRKFIEEQRGPQTVEEVPNVAILGSGGGFRAMVSLSGVFCALKDMGVMDCAMYAAGLSGSAWYLSTLYSHPDWPNIHPRQVRKQLKENISDNWLWMMLTPSWMYDHLNKIMEKKRRGQPVSLTDFFGFLVGQTILKDRRKQPMLSEQQPKVQNAEVPFPLYSCVLVKNDVSAQEYSDWVEFSPYEIGMGKYGTFMQTEHFGSKFFCGKLVKSYEEPPLCYLQGIWGSAFAILLSRVLQGEKLPDDTIEDMRKNGDLPDEYEKMLNGKEEEDGLSEDDEEHSHEETQPNINNTSDDEKKEDKEDITFLGRVLETLVDNIKFLKTRGCRSAKIHNFLRGLSVQDFTEEMEDAAETADQFPLSAKRISLVDGGLAFNSPFPALLRPERDVDIFLSFDFSARKGDLEFPFKELLSAEKWARENNFKFPPIDAQMQYEKFGMKEFYVFRDPNDPSCPVVVHFVLVNMKFKEQIKPGTPRRTKEDKDYANFSLFDDTDDSYSTFNFHYHSEEFNKLADLNEFNTFLAKKTIQDVIADWIQKKRDGI